ncbi:SDR family NAD(P)-dependent oxidoreductase [Streptomyces harbinensis]|uniref:SDR family oxidoreductase n=1 Tax=Streptomyces harbinensis TaxID=1176198 RepID=UPI00339492AF
MTDGRGTVLITGASSGIGEATARRLAGAGYDLVLIARRADRLEALADELAAAHTGHIRAVPLDLTRTGTLDSAVTGVLGQLTVPLRGAVLAAGHGRGHGQVRTADPEPWESQVLVNLLAPMMLIHRLLPALDATGGDLIVVGSVFDDRAAPGYAAYAATKHGLKGFLRSLAAEERPAGGCRLSLLSPGSTNTEFASVLSGASPPQSHPVSAWPYHPLLADDVARTVEWIMNRPAHVRIAEILIDPTDARY